MTPSRALMTRFQVVKEIQIKFFCVHRVRLTEVF